MHDLSTLAALGTANLERVIAIDSQSREASGTIPSSDGQVRLAEELARFFGELGCSSRRDANANLIVSIPGSPGCEALPPLALMVHMDTAEGTSAVPRLQVVPGWDGRLVDYPANDRLHVSVEDYPELLPYVGEDLLHGPGLAPVGLDDKLGMAQLMTLAQVLADDRALPHGPLLLVFRPDEEIGRMEAVVGLAAELAAEGVRHGYTVDGLDRFEVNVENFNAARARVRFQGRPLAMQLPTLTVRVDGVKSHGATAKAEGYRNATVIVARALAALEDAVAVPIAWVQSPAAEVDATVTFAVTPDSRGVLLEALAAEIAPHARRGAAATVVEERPVARITADDGLRRALAHVAAFLGEARVTPVLSEHSTGHQGYTNPYAVVHRGGWIVEYRIRDFTPEGLAARIADVRALARDVDVEHQYVNMGPALAPHPELVAWAEAAAQAVGERIVRQPIRGGTGVDPFLAVGIPVANLGTGYFAPESEKELTSRQSLARHVRWLTALVRVVAGR
ncbi:MAG: hypothetical protein AMXMBFR64_32830 [Myxococcales bacterium]